MKGHLAYQFLLEGGGTRLVQRESLYTEGILRLFDKFIEQMLSPRLVSRLGDIKDVLESGWVVR